MVAYTLPDEGDTNWTATMADAFDALSDAIDAGIPSGGFVAKGDLLSATAADTPALLTVGSNGALLVPDSAASTGLKWTTARYFEGTGSPEAVVTAPVGSQYVDTAATTGAIRWIKATGSGNTGWVVEYGDTGYRNLLALLDNGWASGGGTARCHLRRVGNQCSLEVRNLTAGSTTTILDGDVPSGFLPAAAALTPVHLSTGAFATLLLNTAGQVIIGSLLNVSNTAVSRLTWTTDNTWPAVLPGS
jgi:hypothetical protein